MTQVEIKKGKGIEGLLRGVNAAKPEEEQSAEVVEDVFKKLVQKYVLYLEEVMGRDEFTEVLQPEMINEFLQATKEYEERKRYEFTGIIVSKLMQNSYDAGHSRFTFDTGVIKRIDYLASKLEGTKERPFEITINGDTWVACGFDSENAVFHIYGNPAHSCGISARNSIFDIYGDAGEDCGWGSRNSVFNIQGDTGKNCGNDSIDSVFNIQGCVGKYSGLKTNNCTFRLLGRMVEGKLTFKHPHKLASGFGDFSRNSTFMTPNELWIEVMLRNVPKGNRIILMRPDGTEEIVRDYAD